MKKFNKVLFISNGVSDTNTGVSGGETRFIETAKVWQKQGYKIYLLSTEGCHRIANKFGLKHVFYKSYSYDKFTKLSFFHKTLQSLFLYKKIKHLDKTIVYSANDLVLDVIPAFIYKLFKGKKVKWVATIHWLPPFPPWKRKQASLVSATFFFISERFSLFLSRIKADVLLPISSSTKKQLQEARVKHKHIFVGECGVNYKEILNTVSSTNTEKKYDAVFMKRFQTVKGAYDLIDIWKKVVKHKKNAKLLLIGDGPEEKEMRKRINDAKLNKNFEFTGVVFDFSQKIKLLQQSKIFILPSYEENWAIVIGEAMAVGLPIITYNLPELTQLWGNNANYIKLKDTDSFAKKIIEINSNNNQYKIESIRNKKFVSKFDWEKIIKKEISYINNI